jgi:hypothetical protein
MLRQEVSVDKPKALIGITSLQFEGLQAIVISDGYMKPLGSSSVAVTTFEQSPPTEFWAEVCEMATGKSSISLSEMSKRVRTSEDVRASRPWRVEQQWHDPLESSSTLREVRRCMAFDVLVLNTNSLH